jgi:hypothetical protein
MPADGSIREIHTPRCVVPACWYHRAQADADELRCTCIEINVR